MAILMLSAAGFVLITSEFVIIGLLPALTADLGISDTQAGWLVTIFAFTIVIAGPPLTSLVAGVERRRLFVTILLIFAISNFWIASSHGFWSLAAMRILQAAAQPVFWGVASETAVRLSGPERSGPAIAKIYTGFSMALALGLPIRVIAAGPEIPALSATLNISAVNAGKGLGAYAGGQALDMGTTLSLTSLS